MSKPSTGFECEYRSWHQGGFHHTQLHSSPYLYVLQQGTLSFRFKTRSLHLTRNSCLWLPGGIACNIAIAETPTVGYIIRLRRSASAAHLVADDELLHFYERCDCYTRMHSAILPLKQSTVTKTRQLAKKMSRVWQGDAPYRALKLKATAFAIIDGLTQDPCLIDAFQTLPQAQQDQRIADLLAWIDRNLDSEINTNLLAQRCHLARSRFTQLFRSYTGRSPQDYVRRMRVARACRLLRTSHASTTDICYAVGFGSSARFHAAFQKILGASPGQWRRSVSHSHKDPTDSS